MNMSACLMVALLNICMIMFACSILSNASGPLQRSKSFLENCKYGVKVTGGNVAQSFRFCFFRMPAMEKIN